MSGSSDPFLAGRGFLPSPCLVSFAFKGDSGESVSVVWQEWASSDLQAVSWWLGRSVPVLLVAEARPELTGISCDLSFCLYF